MLRAALKHVNWMLAEVDELGCTTYNAACGIETFRPALHALERAVAPHTMLRAALKPHLCALIDEDLDVAPHIMLRAALKPFDGLRLPDKCRAAPPTKPRAALKLSWVTLMGMLP